MNGPKENLKQLRKEFPLWFNVVKKDSSLSRFVRESGNALFREKNHNWEIHSRILSTYSQSAAIAPNDSEELALAYGNRSSILLHLKKYNECLIDIKRACKITKSAALKDKLEARRAQCLSLRSESEKSSEAQQAESVIRLKKKFKPSKEIPCATDSVSIQIDAKNGRHIVATQDIEPGTVIAIEKSIATIPRGDWTYLNCDRCLKFAWNGVPCKSCTNVLFCSEKCKKEAWSEYHDVQCVIFSTLNFNYVFCGDVFQLAIKIFIQVVKQENWDCIRENILNHKDMSVESFFQNSVFQSHKLKSILTLSKVEANIGLERSFLPAVIDCLAADTTFLNNSNCDNKSTASDILTAKKCIIKLLYIIIQNGIAAQYFRYAFDTLNDKKAHLSQNGHFGVIIATFCSLFNHSCCNNVGRAYIGNQEIVLYAETVIKKGDQLYLSYGPDIHYKNIEKQDLLKQKFQFDCECFLCTENCNKDNFTEKLDKQLLARISYDLATVGIGYLIRDYEEIANDNTSEDYTRSKKIFEDTVTALKIVNKCVTGFEAVLQSIPYIHLIKSSFDSLYGVKNTVPKAC